MVEAFDQQNPEQRSEATRNGMRTALTFFEKLIKGIENVSGVVDLTKKLNYQSVDYWWEKLDRKPIIQGEKLKETVGFFEYNKESWSLLTQEEQKLIEDLLVRAKIYLAYYEKYQSAK